uniref:3-phenylpropionic acid transporter n=1 Tax=Bursaphelenchus xylophilus TaxID=6326 RepID=A0A1I7RYA2_BURXY
MSAFDIHSKPTDPKALGVFDYWYLQYCLTTGLYMLEPWERRLFNSVVLGVLTVSAGIAYRGISAFF